jgi:aldose 1-epimerase
MTYGAALTDFRAPDRAGRFERIVLGFDSLEPYLVQTAYFGAVVGRFANRIAGARFTLDGGKYMLASNNGPNHLHGGIVGFDKVIWQARPFKTSDCAGVAFSYRSADGEEGYPGELNVETTYRLTENDCLRIDYRAVTTRPTHVNLTHHSYFNLSGLSGANLGEIVHHRLMIDADFYLPVQKDLIPTGELREVAGTPFDFRTAVAIGARIDQDDKQLRIVGGYDHTFVLNKPASAALSRAAVLCEEESARTLELWTSEPGLQFYSGNFLGGETVGPQGPFARRSGLCLEPQHYPNSPNEPSFPSTVLRPGEEYRSRSEFHFGVER